ncbi:hypothetical protein IFM89_025616 [Coptis chinensis]|uniref:Uncharacterized protein n=1 Tax=Coptis chinensis TaxID=261450 RepID=A0A835LNK1_9MAGN|nr:hypothetical protein IFM89_025616 [Coptis chinensis]
MARSTSTSSTTTKDAHALFQSLRPTYMATPTNLKVLIFLPTLQYLAKCENHNFNTKNIHFTCRSLIFMSCSLFSLLSFSYSNHEKAVREINGKVVDVVNNNKRCTSSFPITLICLRGYTHQSIGPYILTNITTLAKCQNRVFSSIIDLYVMFTIFTAVIQPLIQLLEPRKSSERNNMARSSTSSTTTKDAQALFQSLRSAYVAIPTNL